MGRDLAQIIDFAAQGGFSSGGPDVRDPTDKSTIAPNVKGVSSAAKHVLNALQADPGMLDGELTQEMYDSWVELSKDGKADEWLNSIEFDLEDRGILDQMRLGAAEEQGFLNFLEGAYRENLQYQAIKKMRDDAVGLLAKAESAENLSPEELARLRVVSNSMAHTSLRLDGVTLESKILEEVQALGEDPALRYNYSGDIKTRDDQLAFAKSVALAEEGPVQLSMLQTGGELLAAGIDSSGRPIYNRRRGSDPLTSNPFIQPVLDRIAMTEQVQNSPLFYAVADKLGMNLAEGERPTTGQLTRVLREVKRDKRRAYRPSGTYMEVDVVDRDRALEIQDGKFMSFIDEKSGDFITL